MTIWGAIQSFIVFFIVVGLGNFPEALKSYKDYKSTKDNKYLNQTISHSIIGLIKLCGILFLLKYFLFSLFKS